MTDEPLTAGEIAANLLGAQGITTCVCAWLDKDGKATWYRMGSLVEAIGLIHILMRRFEEECLEDEEEEE